jgi:hypothetical protein
VLSVILNNVINLRKWSSLAAQLADWAKSLKQEMNILQYIGVEFEPGVAMQVSECLDRVHAADISRVISADLGVTIPNDDFALSPLLEHLYNPWDVLAKRIAMLRPGGHVVVSILNVRNLSVILNLTADRWRL